MCSIAAGQQQTSAAEIALKRNIALAANVTPSRFTDVGVYIDEPLH